MGSFDGKNPGRPSSSNRGIERKKTCVLLLFLLNDFLTSALSSTSATSLAVSASSADKGTVEQEGRAYSGGWEDDDAGVVESGAASSRDDFGRFDAVPVVVVVVGGGDAWCLCWCLAQRGARFLPAPPLEPILNGRGTQERRFSDKAQALEARKKNSPRKNHSCLFLEVSFDLSFPPGGAPTSFQRMADVALQKRLRPLRRSPPAAAVDPEAGRGGGGAGGCSSSSFGATAAASPLSFSKNKRGKAASTSGPKKASFFSVLALCDPVDALLLLVGCLGAAANGAALPLFSLAGGSMVDVLGPAATAGARTSR